MTAIIVTIEGVRTRVSTAEALVTLESANTLSAFLGKVGKQVAVAFADIEPDQTEKPRAETGSLAQRLFTQGWLRNPALWAALEEAGVLVQAAHKESLLSRPCALAGPHCNGDVVVHHVRTANNSGTGIKPPDWYGVPLCHFHHDDVHRNQTREEKEELLKLAVAYTQDAAKVAIKRLLGLESFGQITQEQVERLNEMAKSR